MLQNKHDIKLLEPKSICRFSEYLVLADLVTKFVPFDAFETRLCPPTEGYVRM